jgi:hypothetical protein
MPKPSLSVSSPVALYQLARLLGQSAARSYGAGTAVLSTGTASVVHHAYAPMPICVTGTSTAQ